MFLIACVLPLRIHAAGLDFCVDLLARARQTKPNVFLALVGDGPQRGVYSALHGAAQGLHFIPKFVSQLEVAQHYAAADAYAA